MSWQNCKYCEDYEIFSDYPYQIRKKATKRIIKEHLQQGYIFVHINLINTHKARIIATQFIREANDNEEVDHINHDRSDNHIENLRWVSKRENVRNKRSYNKCEVKYLDELPPKSIKIQLYKGVEFEGYYYSEETGECYYDNGVKIRTLPYHTAPSGMIYVWAQDINNIRRCIYIQSWLKNECIK